MSEEARQKAHELVDAFFDNKEIIVKDPEHGIPFWTSIKDPRYWCYLERFCKNTDKYKIIDDNTIDERYQKLIDFLENMTSFRNGIINVPKMKSREDYEKYVIKNFIRCGAIAKKDLVIGKTYVGSCRNTEEATWLGEYFEYNRTKFGTVFKEKINHFEDDNGFDLFVPLKER